MDAEMTQKILERIKHLEDEVILLRRATSLGLEPNVAEKEFLELVEQMDAWTLNRVLREIPQVSLESMFYGMPKATLEKLKRAVSKNVWKELTECWKLYFPSAWPGPRHNDFLRAVWKLAGEYKVIVPSDTALAQKFNSRSEEWVAYWAEQKRLEAEKKDKDQQDRQRWFDEELLSLV